MWHPFPRRDSEGLDTDCVRMGRGMGGGRGGGEGGTDHGTEPDARETTAPRQLVFRAGVGDGILCYANEGCQSRVIRSTLAQTFILACYVRSIARAIVIGAGRSTYIMSAHVIQCMRDGAPCRGAVMRQRRIYSERGCW